MADQVQSNVEMDDKVPESKKVPCPHPGCGQVFSVKHNMSRHYKTAHTREWKYVCGGCTK